MPYHGAFILFVFCRYDLTNVGSAGKKSVPGHYEIIHIYWLFHFETIELVFQRSEGLPERYINKFADAVFFRSGIGFFKKDIQRDKIF